MKKTNRFFYSAIILSLAAAFTGCGNVNEKASDIKDPGTGIPVSEITVNDSGADTDADAEEEKTEVVPETSQGSSTEEVTASEDVSEEISAENKNAEENSKTQECDAEPESEAADFQNSFKEASIREFRDVLENVRTGITLNRESESEHMITRTALSVMNWSVGTTLTADEIKAGYTEYTNTLSKPDINSLCAMYDLVYQEYLTLLTSDQEQKIEDAGCSDISAYPYGTEPLEPAETLHELMKNYER